MKIDSIKREILKSPKYRGLAEDLINRVVVDCVSRFGLKRAEMESRKLFHQIWGVFFQDKIDYDAVLEMFVQSKFDLQNLLTLHSSTKERVHIYKDFYETIFKETGIPKSIADHGCGLNPVSILSSNFHDKIKTYSAYDIDVGEINFLNKLFKLYDKTMFHAEIEDLITVNAFPEVELSFFLKLFPSLELQKKGSSRRILEIIKSQWVVISYPLKSLSDKYVGMEKFYRDQFLKNIDCLGYHVKEIMFENEIVFILKTS